MERGLLGLGRSDPYFEIAKKIADHSVGVVHWYVQRLIQSVTLDRGRTSHTLFWITFGLIGLLYIDPSLF